ncbi:M48 family metalloprotease [Marinicella sp. S1101]|uniref:M48 family metalloprotease n=1 Tax=Marinicella marina TaxID=2996016 RepID=UPI002260D0EC|nr:M48 family metalloprotease [Marinicella marina]MCX7554955.1 M48 family metalloprotease [Marinicella marina]MDJ1141565.1 M48 family metalloprotease [Marinicella marina]
MKFLLTICLLCSSHSLVLAEFKLPDLGNPADKVLSADDEQRYRQDIKQQMYQYNFMMTDPIVASYTYHLGYQLAAFSNKPDQPFDFFMIPANIINAAAYPGGLIVVYSGLFLETDTESELAGVLAHEIAHVNQRHISRMMAKQQKATAPILLGMLAAIAAAQSSSSGDAPIAIAASMSAIQQQLAINFTRYHEYEADRVGINTLYAAGLNPEGMATFFAKLMQKHRIDPRYQIPEYLRTHPLSVNRVTEAKNRIKAFTPKPVSESELYDYVKERVRVLTADEFTDLSAYYRGTLSSNAGNTNALLYGQALVYYRNNQFEQAWNVLQRITPEASVKYVIDMLKIEVMARMNKVEAERLIDAALKLYPDNEVVLETTAKIMMRATDLKWVDAAIQTIRKLVQLQPENPHYYDLLSIAYYNALKPVQAGEAMARREHLMGRNYRAVRILRNLKKDDDLDYYQSAEINALITAYEPLITERERRREIAADGGIGRRQ